MLLSRTETIGFVIAFLVIAAMGALVFGSEAGADIFHRVNKAAAENKNYQTLHVKIVDDPKINGRYVPASITAHVDQKITFSNDDTDAPHTVTATNRSFDSGNMATGGATWTYTPKKVGTFKYYCVYHPLMKGTLKVQT